MGAHAEIVLGRGLRAAQAGTPGRVVQVQPQDPRLAERALHLHRVQQFAQLAHRAAFVAGDEQLGHLLRQGAGAALDALGLVVAGGRRGEFARGRSPGGPRTAGPRPRSRRAPASSRAAAGWPAARGCSWCARRPGPACPAPSPRSRRWKARWSGCPTAGSVAPARRSCRRCRPAPARGCAAQTGRSRRPAASREWPAAAATGFAPLRPARCRARGPRSVRPTAARPGAAP